MDLAELQNQSNEELVKQAVDMGLLEKELVDDGGIPKRQDLLMKIPNCRLHYQNMVENLLVWITRKLLLFKTQCSTNCVELTN